VFEGGLVLPDVEKEIAGLAVSCDLDIIGIGMGSEKAVFRAEEIVIPVGFEDNVPVFIFDTASLHTCIVSEKVVDFDFIHRLDSQGFDFLHLFLLSFEKTVKNSGSLIIRIKGGDVYLFSFLLVSGKIIVFFQKLVLLMPLFLKLSER